MIVLSREARRFSTSLIARGVLMIFLGIAAIGWADAALLIAMVIAAVLLAALGAFEIVLALRTLQRSRGWVIPMVDGAACIGFAVLSLVFPGLTLRHTLELVAAWMVCYALLTGSLALALWPMSRTRTVLLAWTALDVVLAVLALTYPGTTIFTVLYAGAAYAVTFGALQLASGLWIRRIAVPRVEPTIQATWTPLGTR